MKILVINAGSSSLKYQLINMEDESVIVKGNCERIGTTGKITHKVTGKEPYKADYPMPSHDEAIALVLKLLTDGEHGVISSVDEIDAVGHRIAHGGEKYKKSTVVDDEVLAYLEGIVPINPLHGPPAIKGIRACKKMMPDKVEVGVFDTSFYSNIEDFRYIYPLPIKYYEEKQIRRYGFHGTSHRYVSARIAELLGKDIKDLKIITCHLGNGSSVSAIKNGVAIDTSMGFTPQEGVVMGTRSGSFDPTVLTYIMKTENLTADEAENLINKESGLLGISGISNDAAIIADEAHKGNKRAILAQKMLGNSVKKLIGSYYAELNGLDVLVFTAGIGEHDEDIRRYSCEDMEALGIKI
ncbi:MAG: acetate kinase, partial [Clostridia bacterium]|nr:acetate kinase [Clostridia bacterium]